MIDNFQSIDLKVKQITLHYVGGLHPISLKFFRAKTEQGFPKKEFYLKTAR